MVEDNEVNTADKKEMLKLAKFYEAKAKAIEAKEKS